MAVLKDPTSPANQKPASSLRLPAHKRIATPASQRLSTVLESQTAANAGAKPNIPPKSSLRSYSRAAAGPSSPGLRNSHDTQRTGPPAYSWIPELPGDDEGNGPVEGEKLHNLRRGRSQPSKRAKGGWGRLALIMGIVLFVIIGLAVGLSVGLTVGRRKSNDAGNANSTQPSGTTPDAAPAQPFPLGEYSFVTALRTQQTDCTSNPATWRCYPYTVYNDSDNTTSSASLATFNWIISNTSSFYATNETAPSSAEGVDSNLTISSTNNPFSISFTNQTLRYISASGNDSSPRYTFSFQMHKAVIPSSSILSSGAAAECFYNQTTFTGTLYLNASRSYPNGDLADSTGVGGYQQWPYAVEVRQRQSGGTSVPDCYEYVNGRVGDRVLNGLDTQPLSRECICDYRNY